MLVRIEMEVLQALRLEMITGGTKEVQAMARGGFWPVVHWLPAL